MKINAYNCYLLFIIFCFAKYAYSKSVDDCASSSNLIEQISCYASLAKADNNLFYCDKAAHKGVRYQCYAIYAEYSNAPEICHKIPSVSEDHKSLIDICLSDVALKTNNANLCESIKSSGLRDSCYFKLADNLNNTLMCENIQETGLKSMCYEEPVVIE